MTVTPSGVQNSAYRPTLFICILKADGRIGTATERIQLDDETVWAGSPIPQIADGFREAMDQARQLWFEGKYVEGDVPEEVFFLASGYPFCMISIYKSKTPIR